MLSSDRTQPLSSNDYAAPRAYAGTACFSITALPEPGTLPRLISAFAQRSLVPERWHGVHTPDGELQLDIQVVHQIEGSGKTLDALARALRHRGHPSMIRGQ